MAASKVETWTTVWVVMSSERTARLFGPIGGIYTTEAAANDCAAADDGSKVVEWAASNRYHPS